MHEQEQWRKFRRSAVLRAWCGAGLSLLSFSASLKAQTKANEVPKLVQDLNDKDPAVRGAAAAALDNLHDTAAEPALIAGLKQSSKNVSAATVIVRTLGRFNDAKAVAAIAGLLPGEAGHDAAQQLLQMDPLGIQAAADATASESEATLAAVRDSFIDAPEVGLKVLPSTLRNSKSPAQRAIIVILLADCAAQNPWYEDPPRSAFVQGFLPAATDPDPGVRVAVAGAIQKLAETEKLDDPGMGHPDFGLKEALPVLNTFASDHDADVRTAAMDALGSMANLDANAIIKKHLNDPDAGVKQHAAEARAAAQVAAPEAAASAAPAPKPGGKNAAAPKTAEARKLAQIKKWNDETAIPKLIPLLGDPSSLVRAAAADKLGKLDYRATAMNGADHEQNFSEVPALIEALSDTHALVRAAAAEALGEIGDQSAAGPLVALLKDSKPKVVIAAANALSTMVKGQGYAQDVLTPEDHQQAGRALAELFSSSDQEVRQAAVSALVDVGTLDEMRKMAALLEDSDVLVRNQAARALAQAFYPNPNVERDPKLDELEKLAGPALAKALSVPETRGAALWALAAMKRPPPEAARPLVESLKYNVMIHADGMSRPEIQSTPFNGFQGPIDIGQAIDVLSRTGSPEAEPLLVKFLNIINPDAGKHACAGLATLRDARAVGPLLEVLQRKGVDLQPEAAEALAAFQDPRIIPALIQSLRSENYSLRGAAASALGHFHDPRVAPALIHSLTDEEAGVRLKAAEALGNLGDAAGVEPLGRVTKTNYEAVRALGKLRFPGSVAPLVSVMQDKQVQYPARGEAVAALGKLGDPQAVPALIQTMEQEVAANPSSALAVQCVHALSAIKDPRAIEPLRRLVGKPAMASQEAEQALRALGVSPSTQK